MTKQDCTMFALYLIVAVMGGVMLADGHAFGFVQICVGSLFFGLRLYRVFGKQK